MLCNCLKIYKKITALTLFQLAIIGCSCKKDRDVTSLERETNPPISQHKKSSLSIPVDTEDTTHNTEDATHNIEDTTHNTEDNTYNTEGNTHNTEDNTHNTEDNTYNTEDNTYNTEDNTHNTEDNTHNTENNTHNTEDTTHNTEDTTYNPEDNTYNTEDNTHNTEDNTHNTEDNTHNTEDNTHNTEDNTHNVVATASPIKPGTIEVTDALINPLLDNLIASLAALETGDSRAATAPIYLGQFLKAIYDQSPIDKLSSQSYVFYAIVYKNTDILALTLDRLQGDINEPYNICNIGLTFLQYATYFNNLPAIDLLLQKGADRKIVTKHDYAMDGISIPTGSAAYDIALRLNKNEAAAKLRA
jgi:hypothetical protein